MRSHESLLFHDPLAQSDNILRQAPFIAHDAHLVLLESQLGEELIQPAQAAIGGPAVAAQRSGQQALATRGRTDRGVLIWRQQPQSHFGGQLLHYPAALLAPHQNNYHEENQHTAPIRDQAHAQRGQSGRLSQRCPQVVDSVECHCQQPTDSQ